MYFQYTIMEDGIRIDQIKEPEDIILIPEKLEDRAVVELGPYALAGSRAAEIHLPQYLRRIGAYAFYNCERLRRIFCHSRIDDMGAGLFIGARQIDFLDFTLWEPEQSCLQEMLSELRQLLRVRIHGSQETRLLFPDYYEEMVENTPARLLFTETHGCGHRYRYCFEKRQFQYREYDALFSHARIQEPEPLVTELALGRMLYPYGLTGEHAIMYQDYISSHWKAAGTLIIETDCKPAYRWNNLDRGLMPWFASRYITAADQAAELINAAQEKGHTEAVSWLMNFKNEKFPPAASRRRRFEL